ncbi:D-3-phosphoglycerate dehydrogenase [Clostridiaceae bacterium JG1575]|nr:D-3-phosphoglycerate dehydrogenase [Clostridiaceae bacterium JG1575]
MRKIVVVDGYTVNPGDLSWEGLRGLGEVTVYDRSLPHEVAQRIQGAEIVVANKVPLTQEVLAQAQDLRYVTVMATGYDCVDETKARQQGIAVSNVPAYGTDTVAQFTMALLLELCHQVGRHNASVQEGQWSETPDFCYTLTPQVELSGKRLGLIGCGRIGARVGALAQAFGMEVVALSGHRAPQGMPTLSLEELLGTSHVISLHCPLTEETQGLMNATTLGWMRPDAFLLNASRGALVVEEDLCRALRQGELAGAALDVACVEPLPADSPLLGIPNLILTPHMAWASKEARQRILNVTAENIQSYLQGDIAHRVI